MYKFPSIAQYHNTVNRITQLCEYRGLALPELEFTGTVKLHGSNTSIFQVGEEGDIKTQSRNRMLSLEHDHDNFTHFVMQPERLEQVKRIFQTAWSLKRNEINLNTYPNTALVIYGEWCGEGTKTAAINQIGQNFFIFAIKMVFEPVCPAQVQEVQVLPGEAVEAQEPEPRENALWFSAQEIAQTINGKNNGRLGETQNTLNNIYSIYDFSTWKIKIDFNHPQNMIETLNHLTLEVERCCPVAKRWGVQGIGEGIVWKCETRLAEYDTSDLIFKIKGPKHKVNNKKELTSAQVERLGTTQEFVDMCLTQERLAQGLEYMREMRSSVVIENLGVFLKWIVKDCLKEELDVVEQSGLVRTEVVALINDRAKKWYFNILKESLAPTYKPTSSRKCNI